MLHLGQAPGHRAMVSNAAMETSAARSPAALIKRKDIPPFCFGQEDFHTSLYSATFLQRSAGQGNTVSFFVAVN